MGIQYVDILGVRHGDPRTMDENGFLAIKDMLDALRLVPSNLCAIAPGNIAADNDEERGRCMSYMRRCVDFAYHIDCPQVLSLCGVREPGIPREASWYRAIEFLKEISSYAEERGICLTLESLESKSIVVNLVCTPDEMAQMIAEVDSEYLRANVDLGHLNILNVKPCDLAALKDLVVHVHISDNNGLADTNDLIGSGTTPIRAYLEALAEYGFDRTARRYGGEAVASIEVGSLGEGIERLAEGTRDPDEIVRRCIQYVLREVPI